VIGLPLWSDLVAEFGWKQLSRARRRASPRLPDVRESGSLRLFRRGARLGCRSLHPGRLLLGESDRPLWRLRPALMRDRDDYDGKPL